ncbi:MAG: AcrR family transcriptional regulator [Bacteroidia bacterium]|jgi:AcrR family transcriptional regulator
MPDELSVGERGKQDRRDRIIEAAREIIATQGLERLSTRKIAEHAALSVHTLYSLLGNKHDILTAAMRSNHDAIGSALDSVSESDPITEVFGTIDFHLATTQRRLETEINDVGL